MNKVMTVMT